MGKERFKLVTRESVTGSHPDKFCDSVSDYILDKYLEGDKNSQVAVETAIFGRNIFVGGEVTSNTKVDIEECVREVLEDRGYGYRVDDFDIGVYINEQSPEINSGVVKEDGEFGAGDQGLVYGYATNGENTEYTDMGVYLSHQLARKLTDVRESGKLDYLRPDGKTQVTSKLNEDNEFVGVDTVLVSSMHKEGVDLDTLREDIKNEVIIPVLKENNVYEEGIKYLVNTAGSFVLGFGDADAGLTGRKIVVDSYSIVGGGCFSGKNVTKCDRSGAYMARYLAKNILHDAKQRFKEDNPQEVEVQIGYAIGVIEPVSINVDVKSKGLYMRDISRKYQDFIEDNISCSIKGIMDRLDLNNQKYYPTSAYGHFGRPEFTWENLNVDFSGLE